MLQPVFGDVAIDEGIGGDSGEAKNKEQPQPERGQRGEQEESKVLAHKWAHAKNIRHRMCVPSLYNLSFRAGLGGEESVAGRKQLIPRAVVPRCGMTNLQWVALLQVNRPISTYPLAALV
jgi:hypothetical protein